MTAEPIFCPFCGTKHAMPDCSGRHQQIVCSSCGARGPEVYRWLPYATAVEAWNYRAEPSEVNASHRPHGLIATLPGQAPSET